MALFPHSSPSYSDWMGSSGGFRGEEPFILGLDDMPVTLSHVNGGAASGEISCPMDSVMAPLDVTCEPNLADTAFHPTPGFLDDTSTTAYSPSQAQSPTSGTTLVNSPFSFSHDVGLPMVGNALVDQPVGSFSPLFKLSDDTDFMFPPEPTPPLIPLDTALPGYYGNNLGQQRTSQRLPQHRGAQPDAAAAVALDLVTDTGVNVDGFAPMDSMSTLAEPSSDIQREPVHAERSWAALDSARVDLNYTAGGSSIEDGALPTQKPRKQDTTKRHPCTQCDSTFARTHNLKVHIHSVHKGERHHVCVEPGCLRAFSRKHDLNRHHQSAHTDLGSPRVSKNTPVGKGRRGLKTLKKDNQT